MDPNEALRKLRKLAKQLLDEGNAGDAAELGLDMAEQFQSLDEWMSKGGFVPTDWRRAPSD
jgi:hypothetical protein